MAREQWDVFDTEELECGRQHEVLTDGLPPLHESVELLCRVRDPCPCPRVSAGSLSRSICIENAER
jgi:hypothetical protein